MAWSVDKDKNGYWHVREDSKGRFASKKEAIISAEKYAMKDKTYLRVHNEDAGYESFDFSNVLLPDEWVGKTASEYKIARAEYMIARTRRNEARNDLYWTKILKNSPTSFAQKKIVLSDASRKLKQNRLTLREAKRRYKEAKKSSKK